MPSSLPTVLVVEDDQLILLNAQLLLENAGYRVVAVSDATAALEVLPAEPNLAAVLTDIAMPGAMDGVELAHRLDRERPGVPVFVISGSKRPPTQALPPSTRFLAKPYRGPDLIALLEPVPARRAS